MEHSGEDEQEADRFAGGFHRTSVGDRYSQNVSEFVLNTTYSPLADQPAAIASLSEGLRNGERIQTLLGATGTGKTFTMAGVIAELQRPALVMAHNKTLAAQLCNEFREFFPDNVVEYFVSYYDYYQPEAYVPAQDLYIEKDSSINDEIDRLRHAATAALLARRDVIIVASVSCIYGIGSPSLYRNQMQLFRVGDTIDRDKVLRKLVRLQYERNDSSLTRGGFRVKGEVIEIMPSYAETAFRISLFGDEIESIHHFDPLTGEVLDVVQHVSIWPATHYVTEEDSVERSLEAIRTELDARLAELEAEGKDLEAHRLRQRTMYDLEMIKETGFTSGIENYSRIFDGREPGTPPHTLIDYFPEDFITFVDESHQTIPQIGGMYLGDQSRKKTLVDFGFRLPSAIDNRPLKFDEFMERTNQLVLVSATPGQFERAESSRVVEQIVRPTGIVDPEIELRPTLNQIDDLMNEINLRAGRGERTLVTTLTKKMAEDLTGYLLEHGVRVRYLHSDIDTLERIQIIRELRLGEYDVLVGVNLLREGLDMPEVSLVAILDADKEGFLRGETSLVQTIGRAARNTEGRVLMYADRVTDSMKAAISETDRRRAIQVAYNEKHDITPTTIRKAVAAAGNLLAIEDRAPAKRRRSRDGDDFSGPEELEKMIVTMEEEMNAAAEDLRFEQAARIRDELRELKRDLEGMQAGA
jgi:excinuclease ABC subunit B